MLVAVEIFTLMSETEVEVKNCGWGALLGGNIVRKDKNGFKFCIHPFQP